MERLAASRLHARNQRSTEEQIAFCLRQHESGTPVAEIVRKMGISEQTFYRWKKKFAGMGVAEVRKLRLWKKRTRSSNNWWPTSPRQEDAPGCRLGKALRPARRRTVVKQLQVRYALSERRKRCQVRGQRPQATETNESWSMDFMADQLFDGRRFRLLTIVDNFSRESLPFALVNG